MSEVSRSLLKLWRPKGKLSARHPYSWSLWSPFSGPATGWQTCLGYEESAHRRREYWEFTPACLFTCRIFQGGIDGAHHTAPKDRATRWTADRPGCGMNRLCDVNWSTATEITEDNHGTPDSRYMGQQYTAEARLTRMQLLVYGR
jgi:hypothetical protein